MANLSRVSALAKFLGCKKGDLTQSHHDDNTFELGSQEYRV